MDFVWLFYAKRMGRLLQEGKLASVAHEAKARRDNDVFGDGGWRTACLMFIPLDVIAKIGKRKKRR